MVPAEPASEEAHPVTVVKRFRKRPPPSTAPTPKAGSGARFAAPKPLRAPVRATRPRFCIRFGNLQW